ncbi:Cathepsin F [Aphelenchoides fujianensis]|nr:Cathepsin F [Aphelenchoides fujianensis]
MKLLFVSLLLFVAASSAEINGENVRHLRVAIAADAHDHFDQFEGFVEKYGKKYADEKEALNRFDVFRSNLRQAVEQQREQSGTATFGVNSLSDLSDEEFRQQKLTYRPPADDSWASSAVIATAEELRSPTGPDLPVAWSWRDPAHRCVTKVKDQDQCGACWAFASVGAIECQLFLTRGILTDLSVEQILDCSGMNATCGKDSRGTGDVYTIARDIGGLNTWEEFPYADTNVTTGCRTNSSGLRAKVRAPMYYKGISENELLAVLYKDGAVTVGLAMGGFKGYTGGVFEPKQPYGNVDHAVLLVGYGVEGGKPYWELKNSWGEGWGDGGFFRLKRGRDPLWITSGVTRPVLEGAE